MEVTRKNFKDSLKKVEEAIEECSFLAIDGEFTGLNHAGLSHTATFDTPEERYHKLVQGSSDFLLIQFGICTFNYDEKAKIYTARPFNFYIFPRPCSRAAPDLRFTCQTSSLDFLMSQGFDFNKMIRDGISYLRPVDETRLKEQIQKKHELFASPGFFSPIGGSQGGGAKGPIDIPPDMKEFVSNLGKKVEKFLESGEQETMSLPPFTAFQRKLAYQSLQARFGKEVHLQTKTGDSRERFIVVTKIKGEEDMKSMEERQHEQELAEIDDAVGFTHVIKMISKSGKLVVGHNMLLDVTHTVNQFMYPLPRDYNEFKTMCRCVFPKLIDTKLLANTQPFKERIDNSGLSALLVTTQCPPFTKPNVVIAEDFDNRYKGTEALHEAGYDAYITGQCFIALSNFLGQCQKSDSEHTPPTSELLQPFLNKIFMMRSQDIPYLDLTAPDLSPSRDHVFHLSFPQEWKSSDISQLFAQFGNVYIGWLDETSAYVALNTRAVAPSVLKTLVKKGSVYRIMTYYDHKHQYKWTPQKSHNNHTEVKGEGQTTPISQSGQSQSTPIDLTKDCQSAGDKKGTKRALTPDIEGEVTDGTNSAKKTKTLNVNAPEFTPTSTPEKEENLAWPEDINSADKKIDKKTVSEEKMFTESSDW